MCYHRTCLRPHEPLSHPWCLGSVCSINPLEISFFSFINYYCIVSPTWKLPVYLCLFSALLLLEYPLLVCVDFLTQHISVLCASTHWLCPDQVQFVFASKARDCAHFSLYSLHPVQCLGGGRCTADGLSRWMMEFLYHLDRIVSLARSWSRWELDYNTAFDLLECIVLLMYVASELVYLCIYWDEMRACLWASFQAA